MFQFSDYDGVQAKAKEIGQVEVLPPGRYVVSICYAKDVNEMPGKGYLALRFQVEEGDLEGKQMPARFYYGDSERIGYAKIFKLIQDAGITPSRAFDEQMLLGHKLVIVLKARKDKQGNERVDVNSTEPLTEGTSGDWRP